MGEVVLGLHRHEVDAGTRALGSCGEDGGTAEVVAVDVDGGVGGVAMTCSRAGSGATVPFFAQPARRAPALEAAALTPIRSSKGA